MGIKINKQTADEIERLRKLHDVAVADRVRMHEEIERLRERCRIQDKLISDNADLHDEIERLRKEVENNEGLDRLIGRIVCCDQYLADYERLRAALERIASIHPGPEDYTGSIAREALEGE